MGHANIIGRSVIQEFFNCTGTFACDDAPILKKQKNMLKVYLRLFLNLREDLSVPILLCKDCFMSCRL